MNENYGRTGIVANEATGFTYEISANPREFDTFKTKQETLTNQDAYYHVGDWRILPYGTNDNLPRTIKETVEVNPTAPGMLEKKFFMVWGKGPFMYKEEIKDNMPVRTLVQDAEVKKWLDSWKYTNYLQKCCVDYFHMEGAFTKFHRNKGPRIGDPAKIAKLEHLQMDDSRLACHITSTDLIPTHIAVTDFGLETLDSLLNMKVYPLFDLNDPFKYPTTATYSHQYSFGSKHYTTPPIFGTLEWLRRSTATPIIFKALSKNSINIKYHVESPQEFWDQEEKRLKDNCKARNVVYEDKMLVDYRRAFMADLLKVLASEENTGKVWHTRKIIEVQGTNVIEYGWKITVIDQKIKDFVSAQIAISQRADRAVSASIGLHGSIGNVSETGSSDSGSEQLYAYQNFVNSGTDIPEEIICGPLNDAIKANWPDKDIKIGFFQTTTKREEDVSPSNRIKNQAA